MYKTVREIVDVCDGDFVLTTREIQTHCLCGCGGYVIGTATMEGMLLDCYWRKEFQEGVSN